MKVYKVICQKIHSGMRIEGFNANCYIFTDKKKALQFAYNDAKEYADANPDTRSDARSDARSDTKSTNSDSDSESESDSEPEFKFNKEGSYTFECTSGYDWPDYQVYIEKDNLDLKADIILTVGISD
jgi:hypothetical protein